METVLTRQALRALHQAALIITSSRDIDEVLQHIVNTARELLGARYAALGVPNSSGFMETFIHSGISDEAMAEMDHLPHGKGLLGAIITEQRSIRISSLGQDPRSIGFPANHPKMDSFLGVPIIGFGESLGNLYLTEKIDGEEFTSADQQLAEMFAAHAAVAIHNTRLHEEVERLAVLEERTRIGMDLHDGIIQSIYAVGLTLESAHLALEQSPSDAETLIVGAKEGLNDSIRDIRNFILDLRPHRFSGNLTESIGRLVREFHANTMVEIDLKLPEKGVANLPTNAARTIFLTAQNGLANVARHARASRVLVTLVREDAEIVLRIKDNGIGFNPAKNKQNIGHGLHNMQTRAARLMGSFSIDSAPKLGTTLELRLPLFRHSARHNQNQNR